MKKRKMTRLESFKKKYPENNAGEIIYRLLQTNAANARWKKK